MLGGEEVAPRRLTFWRKGKGRFDRSMPFGGALRSGFSGWPDRLEEYRRYGRKGSWDEKLHKAIRLGYQSSNAMPELTAAWDAGCRDALAASLYLSACRIANKRAEARKLLALTAEDL